MIIPFIILLSPELGSYNIAFNSKSSSLDIPSALITGGIPYAYPA